MSNQGITPGWYQDPKVQGQLRYWNGTTWTNQIRPDPSVAPGPLEHEESSLPLVPQNSPTPVQSEPVAQPQPVVESKPVGEVAEEAQEDDPPVAETEIVTTATSRRQRHTPQDKPKPSRTKERYALITAVGIIIFSVALYFLTLGDPRGNSGTTWFTGGVPNSYRPGHALLHTSGTILYSWDTPGPSFGQSHTKPTLSVVDLAKIPSGETLTQMVAATSSSGVVSFQLNDGNTCVITSFTPPLISGVPTKGEDLLCAFGTDLYGVTFISDQSDFSSELPAIKTLYAKFKGDF